MTLVGDIFVAETQPRVKCSVSFLLVTKSKLAVSFGLIDSFRHHAVGQTTEESQVEEFGLATIVCVHFPIKKEVNFSSDKQVISVLRVSTEVLSAVKFLFPTDRMI